MKKHLFFLTSILFLTLLLTGCSWFSKNTNQNINQNNNINEVAIVNQNENINENENQNHNVNIGINENENNNINKETNQNINSNANQNINTGVDTGGWLTYENKEIGISLQIPPYYEEYSTEHENEGDVGKLFKVVLQNKDDTSQNILIVATSEEYEPVGLEGTTNFYYGNKLDFSDKNQVTENLNKVVNEMHNLKFGEDYVSFFSEQGFFEFSLVKNYLYEIPNNQTYNYLRIISPYLIKVRVYDRNTDTSTQLVNSEIIISQLLADSAEYEAQEKYKIFEEVMQSVIIN